MIDELKEKILKLRVKEMEEKLKAEGKTLFTN